VKVWLVVQRLDWTYAINARGVAAALPGYDFQIVASADEVTAGPDDVVLDFWWNGSARHPRLIRQVSSHRWGALRYGKLAVEDMAEQRLQDARVVIVPSERLERALSPLHPRVMRTPKGFDPELFYDIDERSGPLSVGWAGALKPDKGVWFIRKGLRERPRMATNLPYSSMPGFYNSLDVITCASEAEGDPRTLIEGMACGCFPVTVDVGIVPEIVRHKENGLIVERTPAAFAEAFQWCRDNLSHVREAGRANADRMLDERTWLDVAPQWAAAIEAA
jgi:glycosyltransferase involved in cell wall biosynthesis